MAGFSAGKTRIWVFIELQVFLVPTSRNHTGTAFPNSADTRGLAGCAPAGEYFPSRAARHSSANAGCNLGLAAGTPGVRKCAPGVIPRTPGLHSGTRAAIRRVPGDAGRTSGPNRRASDVDRCLKSK